jgi:hypothetical protein
MMQIRYQAKGLAGWFVIWLSLALRPHDVRKYILTHEAELSLTGYLDVLLTEWFNYFTNSFNPR